MTIHDYVVLAAAVGLAFATGAIVETGLLRSLGHGLVRMLGSQTEFILIPLLIFGIVLRRLKRSRSE
jgi:hypothetical protein